MWDGQRNAQLVRTWAIATLAGVVGTALGAQAPATEQEIPIATGAVRQPRLEVTSGGSDSGLGRSLRQDLC